MSYINKAQERSFWKKRAHLVLSALWMPGVHIQGPRNYTLLFRANTWALLCLSASHGPALLGSCLTWVPAGFPGSHGAFLASPRHQAMHTSHAPSAPSGWPGAVAAQDPVCVCSVHIPSSPWVSEGRQHWHFLSTPGSCPVLRQASQYQEWVCSAPGICCLQAQVLRGRRGHVASTGSLLSCDCTFWSGWWLQWVRLCPKGWGHWLSSPLPQGNPCRPSH